MKRKDVQPTVVMFVAVICLLAAFSFVSCRNPVSGIQGAEVNFYLAGGTPEIEPQIVLMGSQVNPVETPTRAGYRFVGWYKDADFTQPWDFDNYVVNGNMTLFARWVRAGGGGGAGGGGNPSIPTCTHVWSDWVRTEFHPLQETTRTCDLCGVDDVFTPYPGNGGTISGGGTGGRVRYINPIVNMYMMWIPGGSFIMGSPGGEPGRFGSPGDARYEGPQHRVTLSSGFYMSRTAITRGQWRAVMGTDPTLNPNLNTLSNPKLSWSIWALIDNDNLAATHVNWYEAIVFANRLSMQTPGLDPVYEIQAHPGVVGTVLPGEWTTNPDYWGVVPTPPPFDPSEAPRWNQVRIAPGNPNGYRLATEAQWEYAARAGTQTAFNDGVTNNYNNALAVGALGIFGLPNAPGGWVQQVRQRHPNAWGLYDMHGNVWEWAWDWLGAYPAIAAQTDPTGPTPPLPPGTIHRVLRGGGWSSGILSGTAELLRSASRTGNTPFHRGNALGFRLVRPAL